MDADLEIEVAGLDNTHRLALEEVIGRQLKANQRLIIRFTEREMAPSDQARPAQSLDDWTKVYEGLNDAEIESIDTIAKMRAKLPRSLG